MKAAVLTGNPQNNWTQIKDIPKPTIRDDQILIKAIAYAANPTDWKHNAPDFAGNVSGSDVSGIVEEVGSQVSGIEVGDVVSATMHGGFNKNNSAFADHVAAVPGFTIKYDKSTIKDTPLAVGDHESAKITNFELAASVTLGLSTVVLSFAGLMNINRDVLANKGKSILIWGGATATGVLAIQLAKLAFGLNVITTASKKNHQFLKSIGADAVFDYNDSNVVEAIKTEAGDSIAYALDTVANTDTFQKTYDATANSKHVELDNLLLIDKSKIKTDASRSVSFHKTIMYGATGDAYTIWGIHFPTNHEATKKYLDFWLNELPKYVPQIKTSNLKVLNPGLESVNEALLLLHDNKVSGQKIVFRAN
jgi:NADPH:quinone reductase-like Zn-dependent oxidoreductase